MKEIPGRPILTLIMISRKASGVRRKISIDMMICVEEGLAMQTQGVEEEWCTSWYFCLECNLHHTRR